MRQLNVTSPAFQDGRPIPVRHTGDGEDVAPPLQWSGAPDETQEFVVICDDPDAPMPEPWVHWVVYGIPASVTSLPESGDLPKGAREGITSFKSIGYGGPAPPKGHGTHRYFFKVYALKSASGLGKGATKKEVLRAIEPLAIARGQVMGTYERK